jgi:ApbE superfamily uncharacterized protein (UPF0280 family)
MTGGAQTALMPDGRRLHLQHGPIDIVAQAWGAPEEVNRAYSQASERFESILAELVQELPLLRAPVGKVMPVPENPVAKRMSVAAWPHRRTFVTPMAAVAGAVADEVLAAMMAGRRLDRAYVNNGGDIAFHLAPGARLTAGIVNRLDAPGLDADMVLGHDRPGRGLATSGWRGRSLSFGVADAVTVLARYAAEADVAATLVANAVNADHPSIERLPAAEVRDDTDLGDRLVTVSVGALPESVVDEALDAGAAAAESMRRAGLLHSAYLALEGHVRIIGGAHPDASEPGVCASGQVLI